MSADQAEPVVLAVKSVLEDPDGGRVVAGYLGPHAGRDAGWFCDRCRGSRCPHVQAVAAFAAGTGR